jgi:hypothetical protein
MRTSSTSKMKFICPPGSGSGLRIPDMDPGTPLNPDPIRIQTGSTALVPKLVKGTDHAMPCQIHLVRQSLLKSYLSQLYNGGEE